MKAFLSLEFEKRNKNSIYDSGNDRFVLLPNRIIGKYPIVPRIQSEIKQLLGHDNVTENPEVLSNDIVGEIEGEEPENNEEITILEFNSQNLNQSNMN